MRSGRTVRALDAPPVAGNADDTSVLNVSNTDYEAPDPEVSVTFVAPTSGAVLIVIGGGLRDSGGTNRIMIAPEVRQSPDAAGTVVMRPVTSRNAWTNASVNTSSYQYGSRVKPITGLTPGETYFVRLMIAVNGGSTADAFNQQLFAIPL